MIALILALQVTIGSNPPPPLDLSLTANASLISNGYWHPSSKNIALNNVQVPAGAVLDLSGITVHTSSSASCTASLNGPGSTIRGGSLVCDVLASTTSLSVDPTLLPLSLPTAVQCSSGGVLVQDCSISWFGIGIQSLQPPTLPGIGAESMVFNCRVNNPINIGIDWQGPSDCIISHCIVARSVGGVGDGQNAANIGDGQIGIRFGGGGGYVESCHVWGGFQIGTQIDSPDATVDNLTSEGSRICLLQLNGYRIKVCNAFLFSPGNNLVGALTTAIRFGSLGYDCSSCNVTARIGVNGGYGYKAIASEINSALGNTLVLDFMGPQQGPALQPSPRDHWSVLP